MAALVIVVGVVVSAIAYWRTSELAARAADAAFAQNLRVTLAEIDLVRRPATVALDLLHLDRIIHATSLEERMGSVPFLRTVLEASPAVASVYIGYDSGDFFLLRRLSDDKGRTQFGAPPKAAYLVQSRDLDGEGRPRGRFVYLDSLQHQIASVDRPAYVDFDPRTRPWYREAILAQGPIRTEPYVFFSNGAVGTTVARPTQAWSGVVGVDFEMVNLSRILLGLKSTPGTELALIDGRGRLVAYPDEHRIVAGGAEGRFERAWIGNLGSPPLSALADRLSLGGAWAAKAVHMQLEAGGRDWRIAVSEVPVHDGPPLFLASAIPTDELFQEARKSQALMLAAAVVFTLLCLPLALWLGRAVAAPLRRLAGEMEAVKHFDFSIPQRPRTIVKEVQDLREATDSMKTTIRRFLDLTAAVAAEDRFERLLPRLLDETISATNARGAILYLVDDDSGKLAQASARAPDRHDLVVTMPPIEVAEAGAPGGDSLAPLYAALDAKDLHFIAMPLENRTDELLGMMLIAFDREVEDALVRFVAELSGTAAVSLETRQLLRAQKALFEAFIQLIASAIDAKSAHTGGHCERVPELTKMLARAACDATEGPFRDFSLSDDDWEAVHVASWLHDCGKVTTPEFVVDKATKLETIYDRIHEIRMRFEVIKRDVEIEYWRAVGAGGDPAALEPAMRAALAVLDDDFAFVAACNEGGEFMAPERVERLRRIATRTWQRTLDDRIGISHEEGERKARTPAELLPARESLIADKPEHRFDRRPEDRIPEDNRWGFKMKVPELLYDRGELHNLSIGRGTLADEDRYKINDHIVQTIIMLSQLPYPHHLRNVPELAGAHHEKMDGTGYPKRLKRADMSPVARMMAIADIFEALTAADRPYKRGKKLSEAVGIMANMKRDHHVDPQLFDLFLASGVYLEYARRYMSPDQIDDVDVAKYVTPVDGAQEMAPTH